MPYKKCRKKRGGHFVHNSNTITHSKIFPTKKVVKTEGALRIFTIINTEILIPRSKIFSTKNVVKNEGGTSYRIRIQFLVTEYFLQKMLQKKRGALRCTIPRYRIFPTKIL